jgi:hypothetical protein
MVINIDIYPTDSTTPTVREPSETPVQNLTLFPWESQVKLSYRQVQMMSKHKEPKTVMRYDHGWENLD